ncbi:MAG: hypothetical protein M3R02_01670 [Chloroflexota bacterium]|nr:hypothetical protein [Chloroflexota bacterium]
MDDQVYTAMPSPQVIEGDGCTVAVRRYDEAAWRIVDGKLLDAKDAPAARSCYAKGITRNDVAGVDDATSLIPEHDLADRQVGYPCPLEGDFDLSQSLTPIPD